MHDLPGIQPHLLGKIGLYGGALHPDRAFGGGQVLQQFRRVDLCKMHPAGAAAGKLRQRPVALGNAPDQLAGFFHNGQVSGKVGVQHVVHAQRPQQRHHFALHKSAGLHAEFLAQGGTHRRGGAYHHHTFRVSHRLPHGGDLVPFGDAVYRADVGALPAIDADRLAAGFLQCVASVYAHQVGAGFFAHAAPDAFFLPAQDAGIVRLNGHADG